MSSVYHPLDPESRQLRLLRLHPWPAGDDDKIRCDLQTFNLDDAPEYRCISYAWGNPVHRKTILIGDTSFGVTESCYEILQNIQRQRLGGLYCIDQVSINNEDLEERSHQVSILKKDIYRAATSTFAAVGEDLDNLLRISGNIRSKISSSSEDQAVDSIISSYTRTELKGLFESYRTFGANILWSRLWIWVELVLSKRVVMLGKHVHQELSELLSLNRLLSAVWGEIQDQMGSDTALEGFFDRLNYLDHVSKKKKLSLEEAMKMSSLTHTMDRRDKIYAVLPVIDWPTDTQEIHVDYSIPLVELLQNLLYVCQNRLHTAALCISALGATDSGILPTLLGMIRERDLSRAEWCLDIVSASVSTGAPSSRTIKVWTRGGPCFLLLCPEIFDDGLFTVEDLDMDDRQPQTAGSKCNCMQGREHCWPELYLEVSLSTDEVLSLLYPTLRTPGLIQGRQVNMRSHNESDLGLVKHMLDAHAGRTDCVEVIPDKNGADSRPSIFKPEHLGIEGETQHRSSLSIPSGRAHSVTTLTTTDPVFSRESATAMTRPTEVSSPSSNSSQTSPESQERPDCDTRSIRTDNRSYDLDEDRKEALVNEFVDELTSKVLVSPQQHTCNESDLESLLKTFAIMLYHSANHKDISIEAHKQAATFIRHSRQERIAPELLKSLQAWRPSAGPSSRDRINLLLGRHGGDTFLDEQTVHPFTEEHDEWGSAQNSSVHDADYVIFQPPQPPQLPALRDIDRARDFLLCSPEFAWLASSIKNMGEMYTSGGAYADAQKEVAEAMDDLPRGGTLSVTLDWSPISFLSTQCHGEAGRLSETLVYCGEVTYAYGTTAAGYLKMMWPEVAQNTMACLETACIDPGGAAEMSVAEAHLRVSLTESMSVIEVTGGAKDMLQIVEACVWLAASCRCSPSDDEPAYCTPSLQTDEMSTTENPKLSVRFQCNTLQQAKDTSGPARGTCWLDMVRNPVVVNGYPVPRRNEHDEHRGLEVSLDIMVALSHATWATTFRDTFLFKGIVSALVPVFQSVSTVVWHFLINKHKHARMTYYEAVSTAGDVGSLYLDELASGSKRHFVGLWLPAGSIQAGTANEHLYEIKLSDSKPADTYQCELSNISISGGKYVSLGVGFRISRKDQALTLAYTASHAFERQIVQASDMNILFYGTNDKRGWLLDGASGLLHLSRAWMSSKNAKFMSDGARNRFVHMAGAGGREEAMRVLKDNEERLIEVFTSSELTISKEMIFESNSENRSLHSTSDSGYHSTRTSEPHSKVVRKEATTSSTFKSIVLELWRTLEAMYDRLHEASKGPPSFKLDPKRLFSAKPLLVGWETDDVISSKRHLDPRAVELTSNGKEWIDFVRESYAIRLIARTFGDLILPVDQGICWRQSRMPKQLDFLAIPLYIWQHTAERWLYDDDDCSSGCVQVIDGVYWHDFNPFIGHCVCSGSGNCKILSLLGARERNTLHKPRGKNPPSRINVFTAYPMGIALVGRPDGLKGCDKLPALQDTTRELDVVSPQGLRMATPGESMAFVAGGSRNVAPEQPVACRTDLDQPGDANSSASSLAKDSRLAMEASSSDLRGRSGNIQRRLRRTTRVADFKAP